MASENDLGSSSKGSSKEENVARTVTSHSNSLVDLLVQLSSAYNNPGDKEAVEKAKLSLVGGLQSEQKIVHTKAEDKMLASVMETLAVNNNDEGKGKGKEM